MKFISIVIPIDTSTESVKLFGQTRQSSDEFNGFFEFPGGKIERNETPLQAAMREVEEEVGKKLSESELKLAFIWNDFLASAVPIRFYVFITKSDFSDQNGSYKELPEIQQESFKMPPINKVFLREYEYLFKIL